MNKLACTLLLAVALAPALSAQANPFTGTWEGTSTVQRPDGSTGDTDRLRFNLTQQGKGLTGTIQSVADPTESWTVDKGVVDAGTATFDVQDPDGPLMKFSLTLVKGNLDGEVQFVRNGVVRARAKIEATKAK